MHFQRPIEPIRADVDEAALERIVADADVVPLLVSLAHTLGDTSLLPAELRPDPNLLVLPGAGLLEGQVEEARTLAVELLGRLRDEGLTSAPVPDDDTFHDLAEFLVGGAESMEPYVPLFREELDIDDSDPRAPDWTIDDVAPGRGFSVAVIGAGMSGIVAAHRLRQAGLDVVVFEKNDDVGGTWLDNGYPGCRVDVPNAFYSYSFAQRDDWPNHFSDQPTLLEYFRTCADRFGVRPLIRFGTEVLSTGWDEDAGTWAVEVRGADGVTDTVEVNAVVSAVGQLNRPKYPDIDGLDDFDGELFHSARWDHDVDLTGKRVAVIGNAASAVQFIPHVARAAERTTVYQRTANWMISTPSYQGEIEDGLRWLFHHVPAYAQWYRLWQFWRMADGMLPGCEVDPTWPDMSRSVGPMNEMVRMGLDMYLEEQFGDDPELRAAVTPDYPPIAKRVLRDDGTWATTLKRDDVELVTSGIERVTATGIVGGDGEERPADVIILGTGFQASDFLTPMKVVGRAGVELHQRWDGTARAHRGVTVPGFPNLFLMYGPNTNIVISGSIIFFSECETNYVLDHVRHVLADGIKGLDCSEDAHAEYNRWIDEGNRSRAWGASSVSSWYKNAAGHVAQNWPYTLVEYWAQTRHLDTENYTPIT